MCNILQQIIKGPITQHLPKDCTKIAISADSESYEVVDAAELVPNDRPVVIVVGASAEGTVSHTKNMLFMFCLGDVRRTRIFIHAVIALFLFIFNLAVFDYI